MYQIEEIPPSIYSVENESSKRENHHLISHWKYALAYCGLFVEEDRPKSKHVRVDTYWHVVGQMTNENGVLKYPQLLALAKAILRLSYGNVVPGEDSQSTSTSFQSMEIRSKRILLWL